MVSFHRFSKTSFGVNDRLPAVPQTDPPRSPRETLPTMYDLPSEDPEEPGLPDEFHDLQPQLLSRTLQLRHYSRDNYFTASDLNLYYDVHHPLWHKRPDWFLAVNVPRLYDGHALRHSYVVWQEGHSPYVIVEFLSPGTAAEDLGRFYDAASAIDNGESDEEKEGESVTVADSSQPDKPAGKLAVYETCLRVPHYIVYSRYTQRLRYFKLTGGHYQEQSVQVGTPPQIWLEDLEIGLGIWHGEFDQVTAAWLRWCDREGNWLLTDTEQEQQAKEQVQAQLLQAAQKLVATGMELPQVAAILGLTEEQVRLLD